MHEGRPEYEVSSPIRRGWNIDDGTEHQRVRMVVCAGRLRQLQRRSAQRQIVELKVEAKSEILAVVTSCAGGYNAAPTAYVLIRGSGGEIGSSAHVERPLLVTARFDGAGTARLFLRSFLAAAGLLVVSWLLCLRLRRGVLLRWRLLGVDDCDSHQND